MKSTLTAASLKGGAVGALKTVSTVEALRRALEELAFAGEIAPGEPLREADLAERFSVGRHSVRSALQLLVSDGIAEYIHNRGVFARTFSREDIDDIYVLRAAIEIEAVRLARERGSDHEHADAALHTLRQLPADSGIREVVLAAVAVHRAIVAEAGSRRLLTAYDFMLTELRLLLAQAQSASADYNPTAVYHEHRQLVDDLWAMSPVDAAEHIRQHTASSIQGVLGSIGYLEE
ncbi:GntR family transcriptional regulator [Microbacterium sp.]|uniref:GntR family transcriptional regulator n=1 Tax=Microbacterium sp. TaxID=51671 RepID=UPI003F9B998C